MIFVVLKVVGIIGGYRGRANFGKRESGLEPLLRLREDASLAVDATASEHVDRFPDLAHCIAGDGTSTGLAVVVPAYARGLNDVEELRATLEALAKQTVVPEAVLIVDDASPVDLSPALDDWPHAGRLAHIRMKQNTGPAGARSVGLRLLRSWAAGRRLVICLTDSDAVPHGRWCEAMLEAQGLFPGIFCGPTLSLVDSHVGRFHDHFGNLNGRWRWEDQPAVLLYACTCNFSIDTSAVKLQEFDPIFSRAGFEDIEFCWRARKSLGVLTRYCEGAHVYHEYDRGLSGLYKQFWKYGNTEPIMAWMHPDFSFQGSHSLVTGFRDPRLPVLAASMPQGPNAEAAKAIFEKIMRLFKRVQPV
jgi:GT2 family glycosyltransferase